MEKKVLVLANDINRYLGETDGRITEIYRYVTANKILRVIRRIFLALGTGKRLILGSWITRVREFDTIILFDTGNAKYLIRILKALSPETRIILWYWNSVERSIPVESIDRSLCEIWSYNRSDCEKYDLKFNTQFYIPLSNREKSLRTGQSPEREGYAEAGKTLEMERSLEIEQEVYFAGADKDRAELLAQIREVLEAFHISYRFILTGCEGSVETKIKYSDPITPEENIRNIKKSKVVADIVNQDQWSGFTLRPFEAVYYRKKLFTNDPMTRELRFYRPENVFIFGVDQTERLPSFVGTAFVPVDERSVQYYFFDSWLERFFV